MAAFSLLRGVPVLLVSCLVCQARQADSVPIRQALVEQIRLFNQELRITQDAAGALQRRADVFYDLVANDPRAALSVAMSADQAAHYNPGAVESHGLWAGVIVVIDQDDFPGKRSRALITVHNGGEVLELYFSDPPPGLISGATITARGVRARNRVAVAQAEVMPAASSCSVTGEQKVAVVLLDLPNISLPAETITRDQLRTGFFSSTQPSFAGFIREMSYGKTWITGDLFGPFRLTRTYQFNDSKGQPWNPTDSTALLNDAIRAAQSTVDFTVYNRVFVVWPVPNSELNGWSGNAVRGCGATFGSTPGSTTILAMGSHVGDESVPGMLAHEFGHNLGLYHASTLTFGGQPLGAPGAVGLMSDYGDPYSAMGGSDGANTATHFAAPHKSMLGWLETGKNRLDVETNGIFRLQPLESATSGLQTIRVRRAPGSNYWLWFEYRQPTGYDKVLFERSIQILQGALVHYEDPNPAYVYGPYVGGRTLLLDFNPPGTFTDAALEPGKVWSDPYGPLTVRVDTPSGGTLAVSVTYGTGCVTLASASRNVTSSADGGTISITAPASCAWTAASTADWIKISSATSGSGNGTVAYTVEANAAGAARSGTIYIGWQAFAITQAGLVNQAPAVLSASSGSGAGLTTTAGAVFSDANGPSDIHSAFLHFSAANESRRCYFFVNTTTQELSLLSDDGARWLGPVRAGSPGAVANCFCGVDAAGVTISTAGDQLALNLPVVFTLNFAGTWDLTAGAYDASGARVEQTFLANWTVPPSGCSPSLSAGGSGAPPGGGVGTVSVTALEGCSWVAGSQSAWITLTSGFSGASAGTVGYTVAANTDPTPRLGVIAIGGQPLTILQDAAPGNRVIVGPKSVVNGASYTAGIAPSGWVTIFGANLSSTTRIWTTADFAGTKLPTQLDGVSVKINGKPAYVYYVSPSQLNVLAPDETSA